VIEIAGLILGLVGVLFAFERPRTAFVNLFRSKVGPAPSASVLRPVQQRERTVVVPPTYGATQSGREPFFISEPFTDLEKAIAESRRAHRPIFLVIFHKDHPSKSKLYYSLGCFLDYFTTKNLVEDHFVAALVPSDSKEAAALVPPNDPLENCLWVVLSPDGNVLRREGVYANPDEGLKRVRAVIAGLDHA
jgi:hypothetical protein